MSDRDRRLIAAYTAALAETDPDAQERVLRRHCGDDTAMLAELRELLAAAVEPEFLEPPDPLGKGSARPTRLGDFECVSVIDSGATAVVWRARQISLDREVALKVMTSGPGTPPGLIERFHREPKSAASLNHPHIVPVFADGEAGHEHWFAMQLIDGHNLADELKLHLQQGKRPDADAPLLPAYNTGPWFSAVARICADAADALHTAHRKGIVHRDIKPQNLLLDRSGEITVADFGIARDERLGSLTEPGTIAGTWHYMSPEQARIEKVEVNHRTDIYSLGVVLYELLTLTRPFEGHTSQEVLDQIRRQPARSVRHRNRRVPRDLETICMAAIERSAATRYQTAAELRDDLRRFLNHEAIVRQPPSAWAQLSQGVRNHRRKAAAVVLVPLIAWAGFGLNQVIAAADHRDQLARSCDQVLHAESLDPLPAHVLASTWKHLAAPTTAEPLLAARRRLAGYRYDLLAACKDARRLLPEGASRDQRHEAALRSMQRLLRATSIFPDDPLVVAAATQHSLDGIVDLTLLDATGQSIPATVSARRIDALTGMPSERTVLGELPLQEVALAEGMYRFEVRTGSGDTRSFTRTVDMMSRVRWRLPYRAIADPTAGMIQLPGGALHLPADAGPSGLEGKAVTVEPFWLDRCEVTVAEYAAFLQATGRRAPTLWELVDVNRDARLPVVKVTFDDAVAYAEWAGKRLPSYAEWMIAAIGAGPNPRRLPWTGAGYFGNCKKKRGFQQTALSQMQSYLSNAAPVDADPLSCTPEGIFELFGNVSEWTESPGVDLAADKIELLARPDKRIVAGNCWYALDARAEVDLLPTQLGDVGASHSHVARGFRCARSLSP